MSISISKQIKLSPSDSEIRMFQQQFNHLNTMQTTPQNASLAQELI